MLPGQREGPLGKVIHKQKSLVASCWCLRSRLPTVPCEPVPPALRHPTLRYVSEVGITPTSLGFEMHAESRSVKGERGVKEK